MSKTKKEKKEHFSEPAQTLFREVCLDCTYPGLYRQMQRLADWQWGHWVNVSTAHRIGMEAHWVKH